MLIKSGNNNRKEKNMGECIDGKILKKTNYSHDEILPKKLTHEKMKIFLMAIVESLSGFVGNEMRLDSFQPNV